MGSSCSLMVLDHRQSGQPVSSSSSVPSGCFALAQGLPGGALFTLDRNARYVHAEGDALGELGFRPQEIIGKRMIEVLSPEAAVVCERDVAAALRGHLFEHEHQFGSRWFRCRGVPLRNSAGDIEAVLVLSFDDTARKQSSERLQDSEEAFRVMADGTPIMIWVTDSQGGIRFVNRAYCNFFGVTALEVIEKGWQMLLHPEDRQPYLDGFFKACAERKPFRRLVRVRRHDGLWRWIESLSEPLLSSAGEFMGMAGSSPDVTEREEFAAELERLVSERTAELQEISSELEQVSYAITHDMRAPLRAMRGFAELLLQDNSNVAANPQAREHLRTIIRSARRLDLLIRDTLCYTRTLREKLPLRPVDLNTLLREMLETYPQFQPDVARIVVAGPLPLVQGNEAALVQCFSGLLDNAVKFAKPCSTPEVLIRPERGRRGLVRIWVQDDGIGIAPAVLPKVFKFFSRGSRDVESTGAGLALVRKAVQRMGGEVGVASEPGKGSAFWIELPEAADGPRPRVLTPL